MGASGAGGRGFSNQRTTDLFYGDQGLPKIGQVAGIRRTMPGGPSMPTLPRSVISDPNRRATRKFSVH